jgi:hypothetical protein
LGVSIHQDASPKKGLDGKYEVSVKEINLFIKVMKKLITNNYPNEKTWVYPVEKSS